MSRRKPQSTGFLLLSREHVDERVRRESPATVHVCCDLCGSKDLVDLHGVALMTSAPKIVAFLPTGWTHRAGKDACPKCSERWKP